jgi:hypothetical protein
MPRYLIERSLPGGPEDLIAAIPAITETNTDLGITWLHSYLTDDQHHSFCLYEAPNPETIRKAAARTGLDVHRILKITTLDPYAHPGVTHR